MELDKLDKLDACLPRLNGLLLGSSVSRYLLCCTNYKGRFRFFHSLNFRRQFESVASSDNFFNQRSLLFRKAGVRNRRKSHHPPPVPFVGPPPLLPLLSLYLPLRHWGFLLPLPNFFFAYLFLYHGPENISCRCFLSSSFSQPSPCMDGHWKGKGKALPT